MNICETELVNLPETISMDELRIVCHISRLTARYYLKSGLLKSRNSGKKTRCYTIRRDDLITFCEEYKAEPDRFKPPENWYKSCGHAKPQKPRIDYSRVDEYCKYLYFKDLLTTYADLLTVNDVTAITGYNRRTVTGWCSERKLLPIRVAPKILIPKSRLLDFLIETDFASLHHKSLRHITHLENIMKQYEIGEENDEN